MQKNQLLGPTKIPPLPQKLTFPLLVQNSHSLSQTFEAYFLISLISHIDTSS